MKNEARHEPDLPLSVHEGDDYTAIYDAKDEVVAQMCNSIDAPYIVTACNAFHELKRILDRMATGVADMRQRAVIDESDDDQWLDDILKQADEISTKIEAERRERAK